MWARLAAFAVLAAAALNPGLATAATPAGTALLASATITYQDPRGVTIGSTSNTLSTTVAAVGAVAMAPKENAPDASSEGFAAGTNVVRTFTLQNASNVSDAYVVTAVELNAGTLASLAFVANGVETPVTVNGSPSPKVAPGESVALRATVQTAGVAVGTAISLVVRVRTTAAGTANGPQSDFGRSFAIAANGPKLTGIAGPTAPIDKTVDGARTVRRAAGAAVHYAIAFANTGGAAATGVVVDDALPAAIHADPASLTVNGSMAIRPVMSGGHLVLTLPSLAVGARAVVAFDATVDRGAVLGTTIVNTASVSADGLRPVTTLPATIFIGSAGIVYDALSANAAPVNGAVVTLSDARTGAPAALAATGESPNAANADPFTAGSDGAYGFTLPSPLATVAGNTVAYVLNVRAPAGYQNRRIALAYAPDATGTVAAVTATALDGQPLASEGGYALVNRPVAFHDVAGVFPNVPLFPLRAFVVTLTADRPFASDGDRVVYTATVQSASAQPTGIASITAVLPPGLALAPGTARVDDGAQEPVRAPRALGWSVNAGDAAVHTLRFAAVVLPSTSPGQTLTATATVHAASNLSSLDASASTDVRIVAGVLSERGIVTGRVYSMVANARVGVGGARVYREDGASVVTDSAGRFSFLGMRPGMHVLRLDTTSLPSGLHAFASPGFARNRSTTRLIHGILDSGNLEDVEFEVQQR
jgi:uncharacterized repeat protein (TIGR01451 family)